ncbi:hypothetical protein L484_018932 [Morus notabilis]|uniref:Uncharacterized protein n=1 Tax=Morus notabilis TaxID=981085 RepID=W9RDF6_9ROSA|nr:hypothetical protein L484_018932 [Morus notabilis]
MKAIFSTTMSQAIQLSRVKATEPSHCTVSAEIRACFSRHRAPRASTARGTSGSASHARAFSSAFQGFPRMGPTSAHARPAAHSARDTCPMRVPAVLHSDSALAHSTTPSATRGAFSPHYQSSVDTCPSCAESKFLPQNSEQITRFLPKSNI